MVHTTIGVYKNSDYKINGVLPEDLVKHIKYNMLTRYERALIVDGEIKYLANWKEENLEKLIDRLGLRKIKLLEKTTYH